MPAPPRFRQPRSFAPRGHGPGRLAGRRCPHQPSGPSPRARPVAGAAPVFFRTPVDCPTPPAQVPRFEKRPETVAARGQAAPSCRGGRPSDGILGHIDAHYALAYLSSGDPDGAQQVVIDEFARACRDPMARSGRRSRLGRTLADHARLANEGRGASGAGLVPVRRAHSVRVSERQSSSTSVAATTPHRWRRTSRATCCERRPSSMSPSVFTATWRPR